ncbi:mechanosensitive ion channel [Facklamia sp. DSM 111018]|uniref:Mechanosensitive ion channel n=1 Tax=Facklamia lactis TaxID=2749967 RepID=A0ABS0LPL7_9LACT|nr:mechanosensitive ion channel domain-containing protein [Facklamia lactis]MBG9985321.1 mechanosensitive ion channel [Facklamia lactis]
MFYIKEFFSQFWKSLDFFSISKHLLFLLGKLFVTIFFLFLIKTIATKLIDSYFLGNRAKRLRFENQARNKTLCRLFNNVVQYIYYFMLAYSVLSIVGIPVGTLIAGAGVASLAIGLGAKDLVADIVNGFFILLEHQFDVGDHVVINDYSGQIYSIGLRTTVIRDYDGVHHFIPNGEIGQMSNKSRESVRIEIDLLIYPDQNIDILEEVLKKVYQQNAEIDEEVVRQADFLGVFKDLHGRLIYKVRIWARSADDTLSVKGRYYKLFVNAMSQAEIVMPLSDRERITIISEKR